MKKDERQKIKATAKTTVASVLSEEEAAQKQKLEEIVTEYETTLAELRQAEVAAADEKADLIGKIDTLEADKSALETEIAGLKKEVDSLKSELEGATKKFGDLEKQMTEMQQAAAMNKRTSELEEAGLLSSGDVADKQKARIKNMSDDEFSDYKSELLAIQAEWAKKSSSTGDVDVDDPKVDDPKVDDPKPDPKLTASQLLALKDAAKKAKKDLAFLNVPASVDPEEDAKLEAEYASMWEMEEDSK
jgi:chromosome segregation ATPase